MSAGPAGAPTVTVTVTVTARSLIGCPISAGFRACAACHGHWHCCVLQRPRCLACQGTLTVTQCVLPVSITTVTQGQAPAPGRRGRRAGQPLRPVLGAACTEAMLRFEILFRSLIWKYKSITIQWSQGRHREIGTQFGSLAAVTIAAMAAAARAAAGRYSSL